MVINIFGSLFILVCFKTSVSLAGTIHHTSLIEKITELQRSCSAFVNEYNRTRFRRRHFNTNDINITVPHLAFEDARNAREVDLLLTYVTDLGIYRTVFQEVKVNEARLYSQSLRNFSNEFQEVSDLMTTISDKMSNIIKHRNQNAVLIRNATTVDYTNKTRKADLNDYAMELLLTTTHYVIDVDFHVTALYMPTTTSQG
ncbi:uncharacterized protein [Antedon mediterranea]|uniref:uncharacterized protein n=1 Tax=Antedon mediterranea TaxID=105859 RepID=UPI003AF42C60